MAKRIRTLYEWEGPAGERTLRRKGTISEAKLRAWEYQRTEEKWLYLSGPIRDTVREWVTARPDLRIPETLLVGDLEEKVIDVKP
ncbi:MAG TPA: hypothetical protein VGK31_12460 [Thermoanaerobaculia bacterium]|jgi:hypothetical protein